MAYAPSELRLIVGGNFSNLSALNIWSYDTVDAMTTVNDPNYISDALTRGMRAGDLVIVRVFASLAAKGTPTAVSMLIALTVASTGANLSDGQAISILDAT